MPIKAYFEGFSLTKLPIEVMDLDVYIPKVRTHLDLDEEMVRKIIENEDLAQSLILSLVSSHAEVVLGRIVFEYEGSVYEYSHCRPVGKSGVTITLVPKISKLNKVIVLDKSTSQTDIVRELHIDENAVGVKRFDFTNESYYIYEITLSKTAIKNLRNYLLIFDTDLGISLLDPETIATSIAETEEKTTKSKKKRRKRRKSKKTSTKQRS